QCSPGQVRSPLSGASGLSGGVPNGFACTRACPTRGLLLRRKSEFPCRAPWKRRRELKASLPPPGAVSIGPHAPIAADSALTQRPHLRGDFSVIWIGELLRFRA